MNEKLLGRAFEILDELKLILTEVTEDKEHIIEQKGLVELGNYDDRIDDIVQELNVFASAAREE